MITAPRTKVVLDEVTKEITEEVPKTNAFYHTSDDDIPNNCEDINVISASDFLEKTLETPFTNKELLLKRLEEHGIINISEENDTIKGNVDNYIPEFKKESAEQPYSLTIKYSTNSNVEEKITDLHSEYALNVQEDAYLSIIEKLKENNMELEEEVLDDNTIVLTVNLEG